MPAYSAQQSGSIVIDNYSVRVTIALGQTSTNTVTAYISAQAYNFEVSGIRTVQISYELNTQGASSNLATGAKTLSIDIEEGSGSASTSYTFTDTIHGTITLEASAPGLGNFGPYVTTPQGNGYMSLFACSGVCYEGGGGTQYSTPPTWINVYDYNTYNAQIPGGTTQSNPAKYPASTTNNFTVRWGGGNLLGGGTYQITVSRVSGSGQAGPWNYSQTNEYLHDQFNQAAGSIYRYTVGVSNGSGTISAYVQVIDNSYSVIATSTNESRGTVTGGGAYTQGTSVTVTATPKDGYVFGSWALTGLSASSSSTNPYTFTMPNKAVTAKATFWRCVYVYRSGWKPAIPYVYRDSTWKRAEHYIYRNGGWQ